jgi:methylglutaconyl-CoA hydratase
MSESFVRFEIDQSVARISLDRPARRNALTNQMLQQMTGLVRTIAENDQVRVIVVAAEGPVFCAGMDLAEMQQRASAAKGPDAWLGDALAYHDLLLSILDAPQPTLAVVQGPALAGGMGIVLACDLVLAVEGAFFALPEPQRGITASMVTPLLAFRVGAGCASYLLLSGQCVSAPQLHRWGIFHEVVGENELENRTREWIQTILTGSPTALAATKRQIREFANADLTGQLRRAALLSAESRGTADAREGLQAFFDKRRPSWHED